MQLASLMEKMKMDHLSPHVSDDAIMTPYRRLKIDPLANQG